MTRLSEVLQQLERAGAGPYASRAVPQLLMVRKCVSRIDVIVRTGFLPPAYALLEVLIVMIISLMMIARFRSVIAESLLVPFVALVNIYMLRLIKDVDNPFDFKDGARDQSSGEVALFPLDEYRERLAATGRPMQRSDARPELILEVSLIAGDSRMTAPASFDLAGRVALVTGGNRRHRPGYRAGVRTGRSGRGDLRPQPGKECRGAGRAAGCGNPCHGTRGGRDRPRCARTRISPRRGGARSGGYPGQQRRHRQPQRRHPAGDRRVLGCRHRDTTECRVPAVEACSRVDVDTQARQDHQPRQHVFLLRRRPDSLLQRRERRHRAADQVDGYRARAAWHPGQCHCSRLDRDGHDGGRPDSETSRR